MLDGVVKAGAIIARREHPRTPAPTELRRTRRGRAVAALRKVPDDALVHASVDVYLRAHPDYWRRLPSHIVWSDLDWVARAERLPMRETAPAKTAVDAGALPPLSRRERRRRLVATHRNRQSCGAPREALHPHLTHQKLASQQIVALAIPNAVLLERLELLTTHDLARQEKQKLELLRGLLTYYHYATRPKAAKRCCRSEINRINAAANEQRDRYRSQFHVEAEAEEQPPAASGGGRRAAAAAAAAAAAEAVRRAAAAAVRRPAARSMTTRRPRTTRSRRTTTTMPRPGSSTAGTVAASAAADPPSFSGPWLS